MMDTPMGKREPEVVFETDGNDVSGTFKGQMGSADFSGGRLDGDKLSVALAIQAMGQSIDMTLDATIDGDKLVGEIHGPRGAMKVTGTRM